jgi:ribosomal protein S19
MKIPFVDSKLYSLFKAHEASLDSNNSTTITADSVILTTSRSSVIVNNFVGKTFSIYNGRKSTRLLIKQGMVGYPLGAFIFTKNSVLVYIIVNATEKKKKKCDVRSHKKK